jgi:prepilin-type N-terminal cleavage/methylation domain-containing protein
MKTSDIFSNRRGFTLIEIAIVLVIIGLLVGMGANMIGPLTQRAKLHETKDVINAAAESIISYGASNNALPDISTFSSVVRKSTDVWKKPLYYILDDNLTDNTIGGICGRKSTNLSLNICPDAGCSSPTDTVNNVAFIVLSSGGNVNNQTEGTQSVTSSTTINTYDQGIVLDDYNTDINRPEAYDDIMKWISMDELRIKAGCIGAPLRIVNNELPYGFQGSAYNAAIFADGGVPYTIGGGEYRWCREESASTGLTFTPSTLSSDCLNLTESLWIQADQMVISGSPSSAGSFSLSVFVRDDNDGSGSNDNVVRRTMVLTLNPDSSGNGGGKKKK